MPLSSLLLTCALVYTSPWLSFCPRQPFGPERGILKEEWSANGKIEERATTWFDHHGAELCTVVHSVKRPGRPWVALIVRRVEVRVSGRLLMFRSALRSPFASGGRDCAGLRGGKVATKSVPIAAKTLLGREAKGFETDHPFTSRLWLWEDIPLRQEILNPKLRKFFAATEMKLGDQPEPEECRNARRHLAE